tara:strand:+ start:70 stop:486 length:417 start_codon:yes stop_codon:yes gene_type:complete
LVVVVEEEDHNHKEVMQVFLVPSHSPQHTQQEAVVEADQDYNPMVVAVDPVVVEVDKMEPVVLEHNHMQIQELLNMEMMVVLLAIMLVVVVEQAVLVNHIQIIQVDQDGVELEDRHHQHSKILMQDMVEKLQVVTQVD